MRICITVLLLLLSLVSNAQKTNDIWIEGRGKMGFLAAHRSIMGHLPTEHAFAGELSVVFRPKGKKNWHQAYNYPTYGVSGFVGSVGNQELLGNYFGVFGFVNFPFISREHYVMAGKLGCGLAYGNKYYDPETNILGMAVSTPVNAHVVFGLENRFVFGNHWVSALMDMTHFSNGAMRVPNLGLNIPYLSLGYGYRVKQVRDTTFAHVPHEKSWEFGFMAIGTAKEVFPVGGNKYPIFGLHLIGRRFFRPKTAMEVSFDIMSKQSTMDFHADVPKTQAEIIQLGIFTGYILPLDRFHLMIGMGAYVRDKFKPEDPFYHRLGMRYRFDNGLNLNIVLKSHWARADYVEYGIGYTFKK